MCVCVCVYVRMYVCLWLLVHTYKYEGLSNFYENYPYIYIYIYMRVGLEFGLFTEHLPLCKSRMQYKVNLFYGV